jgi:homoaconitase
MNFLTSPEITTAMTFAGSMEFNPMTDSIVTPSGKPFKFEPPAGESLPTRGFDSGTFSLFHELIWRRREHDTITESST